MKAERKKLSDITFSFKHLILFMCVILLFISVNSVTYMHTRQNSELLNRKITFSSESIQAWIADMDSSLEKLEKYLFETFNKNSDLNILLYDSNPAKRYSAKKSILNTLKRIVCLNGSAQGAFVFLPDSETPIYLSRALDNSLSITASEQIRTDIINMVDKSPSLSFGGMWNFCMLGNAPGLLWVSKIENGICGAWIDCDTYLANGSKFLAFDNESYIQLLKEGSVIHSSETESFDTEKEPNRIQLEIPSQCLDLSVILYLSQDSLLSQEQISFDYVWYAATILVVIFLIVFIFQFFMYYPIRKLTADVRSFRDREEPVSIRENYKTLEVAELSKYINQSLLKLREMKISTYEARLSQQQTTQEFLLIRHKTHFFINCLSVMHSLANERNYSLISKMTLFLTEYLRRIDYEQQEFVRLEDELHLIHSYIRIQEIRFSNSLQFIENVPIDLFEACIPPLILQTFVENAVEHARIHQSNNMIKLEVSFHSEEGSDLLYIDITDNGAGFSEEYLNSLKNSGPVKLLSQGHGAGISNAIARLQYIYHNQAIIHIQNEPEGGAHIHMRLPIVD